MHELCASDTVNQMLCQQAENGMQVEYGTCLRHWHVHESVYARHPPNKLVLLEKQVWDAHVGRRPEGFADQLQQLSSNLCL